MTNHRIPTLRILGTLALLFAVAPRAWGKTDATCLTGSDPAVANDAPQIAALRALVDHACPCASFDGGKGKAHRDYLRCVNSEISAVIRAGELRPQCKRRVTRIFGQSICGRKPELRMAPCIQTGNSGMIT